MEVNEKQVLGNEEGIKTTVVIPNYNGINYIEECMESLLKSDVPLRIIVVDNKSGDGSRELLAEKYSKPPEEILPEAAPFETAKSYREKKAMPIIEKMAKVMVSIYSAYVKLKRNYESIESMYHQEKNKNNFLESLLNSASKEMRSLKAKAKDLERVKKYFGKSNVDEAIETVKQQERINSAREKLFSR